MPRDGVFVEMNVVPGRVSALQALPSVFFFLTFGNAA
jgi:hypothetical protein